MPSRRRCSPARGPSSRRRSATTRPSRRASPGTGRLPRYTWHDAYAELREKLDALGRALGGDYRVLVDANQHVDREAAARRGVGFYGKNTLLITRRHGSWVVLGTLVTDGGARGDAAARTDCGECRLCIDACPTGALDEPGVARLDALPLLLDAGAARRSPGEYRAPLERRVYGCDICQDVCPWNRGVEKRRAGEQPTAKPSSRSSTGWKPTTRSCARATTASTSRATTRASSAATRSSRSGTSGGERERAAVASYAASDDELLREHALWALDRIEERT